MKSLFPSWPGLSRPSRGGPPRPGLDSARLARDGRDKPGHDGRRRGWVGLSLSLLLAACATTPEVGWQARHAAAEALREAVRFAEEPLPDAWSDVAVATTSVPINDADLEAGTGRLVYAGGVQITSDFNRLHGLSDIRFDSETGFYAVSDEGLLVHGRVQLDADGRLTGVQGVQVRPLTDPDGQSLIPKYLADAEGLAILPNGDLLVSFERLHRVWRYDRQGGRYLGERVLPNVSLPENEGFEGIAVAGERLWLAREAGGLWSCSMDACRMEMFPPLVLPGEDSLRATALAVGPDGALYGLQRAYHADRNTNSIQIARLESGRDGAGGLWSPLVLFTAPTTVDNFEGLAAVRRSDGGVRLYILSDDNFNPGQRTLLLAFDVR